MKKNVAELLSALAEKGNCLRQLKGLLQVEQSCLVDLDLAKLEENQQEIVGTMDRMATLSARCQAMIASLAAELGLSGTSTLTPVIERLPEPDRGELKKAQVMIRSDSQALNSVLTLNRGLLQDSLNFVEHSVNFFNRLFNPGDTYGMAGSLVSRRGGSRFVCKEV